MNILLLGSGGRESALATSLAASPRCDTLYVAPGNGGTASFATNVELDILDGPAVAAFADDNDCGLVVVGPEAPLVAGIADDVREAGIDCFGPGAAGARLEGSKDFSKQLMKKYDLPTAASETFSDEESAAAYVREQGAPIVVKANGLAAGKGVTVASTLDAALTAVHDCFNGKFGDSGKTVVIEEMMRGPECSILAVTDGTTVLPMEPSQDHKRALEGDTGPNTGGMGAYSPVPIVSDGEYASMIDTVQRAVVGLHDEEIDYRGMLYAGFMLTAEGPKLLEFNVRFGDPETQAVLPRLQTDLVDIMVAAARRELHHITLDWSPDWAVTVVLASGGYPGPYETGYEITGIEDAAALDDVTVYHAGTKLEDGKVLTAGGRVLNVTALGETFNKARDRAYEACDLIDFKDKYLRRDIGTRALKGRGAWES